MHVRLSSTFSAGAAIAVLAFLTAGTSAAAQQADTWYVDDDACPGPGTGTQADPYCSIQTAIDGAADGDTIHVAAGTYAEHEIKLRYAVRILGAGKDQTIVDAGGLGRVFDVAGAVIGFEIASLTMTGGNSSTTGGGIHCRYGAAGTLREVRISGNVANRGGAVGLQGDAFMEFLLESCEIVGNHATAQGGGLFVISPTDLYVRNSLLAANTSGSWGVAMYAQQTGNPVVFESCTVVGHELATDDSNYSILTNGSGLDIINSVIADAGADRIRATETARSSLGHSLLGTTTQSNLPDDGGNLTGDPTFVDAANGDYRLAAGSLGIDAGHNLAASDLTADLAGSLRFMDDPATADTGSGSAPIVDMGAYEYRYAGTFGRVGPGCVHSAGAVASLKVTGGAAPAFGQPLGFTVEEAPAGRAGIVALGLRELGIDLAVIGAPACVLGPSIDLSFAVTIGAFGSGDTATVSVPNLASLVGAEFWVQALLIDPPVNSIGIVVSEQFKGTLGYPE